MVFRVRFEDIIKDNKVVLPSNVVVPFDVFEIIFAEVVENPTYKNMMEVNDLGLDEEGNQRERGYSEFLKKCKEQGILK